MTLIRGGTFTMGCDDYRFKEEGPAHAVTVSGFFIDTTEVTQADYEKLMGSNPSQFKGLNNPIESVSWFDAIIYCNARSKRDGLDTVYSYNEDLENTLTIKFSKKGYRLPTEAEWEYACRAGTKTKYYWGERVEKSDLFEWSAYTDSMHNAVGKKKPNPWKLYDMLGNVAEWCSDWFALDYYIQEISNNPTGFEKGTERVIRGGKYSDYFECAFRQKLNPILSSSEVGFRCVLPLEPQGKP